MKNRATNSEDSTRSIFASGIETMSNPAISALPKIDSVKRIICLEKSSTIENASNLLLPVKLSLLRNTNLVRKTIIFVI